MLSNATRTRKTFAIHSWILVFLTVSRFFTPAVSDTALTIFALFSIGAVIAALSEDLTGKYQG